MVKAGGTPLEEGCNDNDSQISCECSKSLRRGPRDRFGQLEILMVLALTKVLAQEKLRQADNSRTLPGSHTDQTDGCLEILRW